jgi:ubiquitin-protein ligase
MQGPAKTCYEAGVFEMYVKFPEEYPLRPPEIRVEWYIE